MNIMNNGILMLMKILFHEITKIREFQKKPTRVDAARLIIPRIISS